MGSILKRVLAAGAVLLSTILVVGTGALLTASDRVGTSDPPAAYVGSAACQRCHETAYTSWRRTLHVQMTKPIGEAQVEGAFGADRPVRLEAYGRSYAMEQHDGR